MSAFDALCAHPRENILRRCCRRLIRLDGSPRQIALGFALGIMVGMSPFWGMHIVLSLGLVSLLGWNRIAAVIGVNITNVFTAPLIYPVNYWVGLQVSGFSAGARWPDGLDWETMMELIRTSPMVLADLSVGGLVLGLPLSIASYFLALRMVRFYRARHAASAANQNSR